mmetsp:Transcript_26474/g.26356  ORF Transcript_26474/g.26356 Transcript_26474/m.26356 type:complete len:213 (-) Transcript_26474:103-741(-)
MEEEKYPDFTISQNNGMSNNFSQSTPSEMSQAMMTREEVKDIMNIYSASIENCEHEIEISQNHLEETTKNLSRIEEEQARLEKDEQGMESVIEKNEEEIEDLQRQLAEAQEKYKNAIDEEGLENAINVVDETLKSRQDVEASEVEDIENGEEPTQMLHEFLNIANSIQRERRAINKLDEENFKMKYDEVLSSLKHEFEEDEYYHPGLLRFFS